MCACCRIFATETLEIVEKLKEVWIERHLLKEGEMAVKVKVLKGTEVSVLVQVLSEVQLEVLKELKSSKCKWPKCNAAHIMIWIISGNYRLTRSAMSNICCEKFYSIHVYIKHIHIYVWSSFVCVTFQWFTKLSSVHREWTGTLCWPRKWSHPSCRSSERSRTSVTLTRSSLASSRSSPSHEHPAPSLPSSKKSLLTLTSLSWVDQRHSASVLPRHRHRQLLLYLLLFAISSSESTKAEKLQSCLFHLHTVPHFQVPTLSVLSVLQHTVLHVHSHFMLSCWTKRMNI